MDAAVVDQLSELACAQGMRRGNAERPTALVVSYDPAKRNQVEGWLEAVGLTAAGCPGPGVPVVCPQMHGGECPRAQDADVMVLDLEAVGQLCRRVRPRFGAARHLP